MTLTRDVSSSKPLQTLEPTFDYYTASLGGEVAGEDAFRELRTVFGGQHVASGGKRGYAVTDALMHGQRRFLAVSHGGSQGRPLVEVSGGDAERVVPVLRQLWPDHHVTRLDSAVDFDGPGAWDAVSRVALLVARTRGVQTSCLGDWLDPGSPRGRTLGVGSRTSAGYVRVYEKGKQLPLAGRPHWVRVELELKPQKVAGKRRAATLTAHEAWGGTAWSSALGEALLEAPVERVSMSQWHAPDDAGARTALMTQYGAVIERWAEEVGDDARFLDAMRAWL